MPRAGSPRRMAMKRKTTEPAQIQGIDGLEGERYDSGSQLRLFQEEPTEKSAKSPRSPKTGPGKLVKVMGEPGKQLPLPVPETVVVEKNASKRAASGAGTKKPARDTLETTRRLSTSRNGFGAGHAGKGTEGVLVEQFLDQVAKIIAKPRQGGRSPGGEQHARRRIP